MPELIWAPLSDPSPSAGLPYTKKKAPESKDPWIRVKKEKQPGLNVASMMRNKPVTGDIGMEIEVEGKNFPKSALPPGHALGHDKIPSMWKYTHDGSLRGEDNAEYVFKQPLKFEQVPEAINALWDMFKECGSKLDESNRTSVHVHLNAQKWHLNRICAFTAIYFSLEELLTEWCGDHRVGNLFCLRAKDAPAIVTKLKKFIAGEGTGSLTDGLHYAGLNVQALMKFGSIEIRSLRGCTDPQTILDWVETLERIYKISADFPDPRAVCDNFSGEGPMAYLFRILGPKAQVVKDGVQWDNQRIMNSLYEGIRLAQDLCYCREWSEYEPIELDPDPFQRDPLTLLENASTTNSLHYEEYLNLMNTLAVTPPTHNSPSSATADLSQMSEQEIDAFYEEYHGVDDIEDDEDF